MIFRCILFYVVIIAALRLMGKREVGELSVLDVVIAFVMSELLALSISNLDFPPFKAILAIGVLVVLQFCVSLICIKCKLLRDFFEGVPVMIICDGVVNQKVMLQQRYTIDDLMVQLRAAGVADMKEVAFAILENSGQLTVLKKQECSLKYPFPLISDGKIQKKHLKTIHKDEQWLLSQCKNLARKPDDIFILLWTENGFLMIDKQ